MKKFKPVLKFVGVYLLIVIALSVLGIIAGVLYFVISHTKPSELSNMLLHMDTTIDVLLSDIFMLAIPLVLTWKFGLIDLAAEFRNGRDTFRNMKLPILVGVLWFLADTMLEDLLGIEMPEELLDRFRTGTAYNDDKLEIKMNNWFAYVHVLNGNIDPDDIVCESDISVLSESELQEDMKEVWEYFNR